MMRRLSLSLVAALLVGCAGAASSPGSLPARQSSAVGVSDVTTSSLGAPVPGALMRVSPAACDHRRQVLFHPAGGVFRMPPCAGWSGHIGYPYVGIRSLWVGKARITDKFDAPTPPGRPRIFC